MCKNKKWLVLLVSSTILFFGIAQAEETTGKYANVAKLIQKKCENSEAYKKVIAGQMAGAPFAHDKKLLDSNVNFRYFSECECMPNILSQQDLSAISETDFDSMLKKTSMQCAGQGFKKYWTDMCDSFMRSEIKDDNKRIKACQCINPILQNIDDNSVMDVLSPASKETNENAKKIDACVQKFK